MKKNYPNIVLKMDGVNNKLVIVTQIMRKNAMMNVESLVCVNKIIQKNAMMNVGFHAIVMLKD